MPLDVLHAMGLLLEAFLLAVCTIVASEYPMSFACLSLQCGTEEYHNVVCQEQHSGPHMNFNSCSNRPVGQLVQ
jgi:hypothetical protein